MHQNDEEMEEVENELFEETFLEKVPLTRRHNSPVWNDFDLLKDKRNDAQYGKCKACGKIIKVRFKKKTTYFIIFY